MKLSWRGELPGLGLLAFIAATAVWGWVNLPDRVPVHWNLRGEVDRFGSKAEGLLILPAVVAGVYLLLLALPFIDPARANYARFAGAYRIIRVALVSFFAAVFAVIVASTAGVAVDVSMSIGLAIAVVFVILGSVLHKTRPNWFVGIRTPWTLSSERSWTATHRWGGRVFVVAGVLFGAAILLRSDVFLIAVLIADFAGLAGLVVLVRRLARRPGPAVTSRSASSGEQHPALIARARRAVGTAAQPLELLLPPVLLGPEAVYASSSCSSRRRSVFGSASYASSARLTSRRFALGMT